MRSSCIAFAPQVFPDFRSEIEVVVDWGDIQTAKEKWKAIADAYVTETKGEQKTSIPAESRTGIILDSADH